MKSVTWARILVLAQRQPRYPLQLRRGRSETGRRRMEEGGHEEGTAGSGQGPPTPTPCHSSLNGVTRQPALAEHWGTRSSRQEAEAGGKQKKEADGSLRKQWSCPVGRGPRTTQAQPLSAGPAAAGTRPEDAGEAGLRMLFRVQHTAPQRATVLGLLLGPPAGALHKLLERAKGELPPAACPAVQGPHRPASSFPLLPQTLPPSRAQAQVCFGREPARKSVFPHSTAWLGRCSSRLIYSQAPRPHALQRCLPATGASQSVSIFIPQSRGDNGEARNSLEDIHVKMTDRSPAPG